MVGTIKDFSQRSGSSGFYENVDVALSTDFYKLSYVYVVSNKLITEQDSLEHHTETAVVPD
jgi:cell shape-determining protein MreC